MKKAVSGLMVLFMLSTNVVFAQKSRRVVREEGLTVQPSAPVGGTAVGTGGGSPEIYGADGGATKASITSSNNALSAGTGVTPATTFSAGRGAVSDPIVAATASTAAFIPTTSNDQSMLPMLMAALAGAMGMGGNNGAKASTGPTGTNTNTNTNANTTPASTTPANTTPGSTTAATGPVRSDATAAGNKCRDYVKGSDQVKPPVHAGFDIRRCGGDDKGAFTMSFTGRGRSSSSPVDVFPVAAGKIFAIDTNTAYGCRVTIKHDQCPAKGVAASGPCYSVYGGLKKSESGACPEMNPAPTVGASVTTDTKIGLSAFMSGEFSAVRFEFRSSPATIVETEKYECAFTTNENIWKGHYGFRCCKEDMPSQGGFGTTRMPRPEAPAGVQ